MKTLLLATVAALTLSSSAFAADAQVCRFGKEPVMRITRIDPTYWTLEVGEAAPVRLNVGSQFATAHFKGKEYIFWTRGVSVEINGRLIKGSCKRS